MDSFLSLFPFLTQLEWDSPQFLILFFLACVLWLSLGGPAWLLSVISGFAYGVLEGSSFILLAMVFAATCVYIVSRLFSRFTENFVSHHAVTSGLKELLKSDNGFWTLFLLKLNPVIPFMPIVVFSAFVHCPLSKILLASALGAIPLNLLWCFQGSNLASLSSLLATDKETLLSQREELFYVFFLIATTIALIVFLHRVLKKCYLSKPFDSNTN